jgi:hypothetical protein
MGKMHSNRLEKFLKIGILLSLSACATSYLHWTGPKYKKQQDFVNDRYECFKETQQRFTSARVNQYGGTSDSVVMPLCSAFKACLATKGFYESGSVTDPSIFNQSGHFFIPEGAQITCKSD